MSSRSAHPVVRWLPLAILALAAAARLTEITSQSLWFDEWFTVETATRGRTLGEMLGFTIDFDAHPPLYYLLMWLWVRAVGLGHAVGYVAGVETLLRLPSLALGLVNVFLLIRIGRDHFGQRTGLIAGLLAALSTVWILRDAEARMYPLFVTLSLLGFLLLVRAVARRRTADWLLYAAAAAALLYTHYLAPFVLVGHAVYAMFHLRKTGWRPLWALGAALAFVPWVPVVLTSLREGRANTGIREPLVVVAEHGVRWLLNPFDTSIVATVVTLIAWALALWGLSRALRDRDRLRLVVATLLLPGALWWGLSLVAINLVATRYFIVFLPWIYLLLADGLDALLQRQRIAGALAGAAVVLVTAAGTLQLLFVPVGLDWRTLRNRVVFEAQDAVIANSLPDLHLAAYYFTGDVDRPPLLLTVSDPTSMPLGRLAEADTIWVIKTSFGPWDARNWSAEQEAFFLRWSNDTTTLEASYLVAKNTVLAELDPIGPQGATP